MKKIAILGKGTAGCISYLKALQLKRKYPDVKVKIDWYYDPKSDAVSVGEGTTPHFVNHLTNFKYMSTGEDLEKLDARPKIGIEYQNWGGKDFIHHFGAGMYGLHFNATKFQEDVFTNHTRGEKVKIHKKSVSHDDIDSDIIVDCTGKPESFDDYDIPKFIPVNSVHVVQCSWNAEPKYLHTKTIARKWGWVFVIPLTTRCSVGYLYNRDISTLDQVKEDIQEVIHDLDVTATTKTNSFHFDNYKRKKLFDGRVAYAGNSGFFLEPMEATTLDSVFRVVHCLEHKLHYDGFNATYDYHMDMFFREVEYFIMLHYASGSKWNNEFWDFAKDRGMKAIEEAKKDKFFSTLIQGKNAQDKEGYTAYYPPYSWKSNINGLGLQNEVLR